MKGLSEEQQAAVEEFVAAFVAYRRVEDQLRGLRQKLVVPAIRVKNLQVPSLLLARALLRALGLPVEARALRAMRASLRTRLTRSTRDVV